METINVDVWLYGPLGALRRRGRPKDPRQHKAPAANREPDT